jgi:hypothetical protein
LSTVLSVCRLHHLDPVVGDAAPEESDAANVWVFAFGSNMDKAVLEGRRMITPAESVAAKLPNYCLTFRQPGLPYREPGFATIEPLDEGESSLLPVHGVAHRMTEPQWTYYKESEGAAGQSDDGYGVIEVDLEAYDGRKLRAFTLQTQPKTIARLKGRAALPSKRYLNILRTGARTHNLAPEYQAFLQSLRHYEASTLGSHIGALLMAIIAFGLLFPFFTLTRLYRKATGLKSVKTSSTFGRFQAIYFSFVFNLSWRIHEIMRPILGCGCTIPAEQVA